jgi:hypothetical protein
MTIFFLLSSYVKPGYVEQTLDMIEMLKIGNDKNIDLENFCFYCKVIKSIKTFHCMICGKCVEKFDHHCVYINNCLGYRNHKYFILLIVFLILYVISATFTRIFDFMTIDMTLYRNNLTDLKEFILQCSINVYTVLVNFMICFPL